MLRGDPNGRDGPRFPAWEAGLEDVMERGKGKEARDGADVVNLTASGFLGGKEDAVGRCGWWFESAFAGGN